MAKLVSRLNVDSVPAFGMPAVGLLVVALLVVGLLVVGVTHQPSHASALNAGPSARRVTTDGNLWGIVDWRDPNEVIVRSANDVGSRARVDLADGTIDAVGDPSTADEARTSRAWVSVSGTMHRLVVDGRVVAVTDRTVLGRPDLAPNGSWLAVARYPRGSGTSSAGALWRLDLRTNTWRRLTPSRFEASSPRISPDGTEVAFLRDGDLWIIDANRTVAGAPSPDADPAAPAAMLGHEPPRTIRVKHLASMNQCRSVEDGRIDVLEFEEYVKRVVPHEVPAAWPQEVLKAQAIAARTYGWYSTLRPAGVDYDVTDTVRHQQMCDARDPRTDAAVDATRGQHLVHQDRIIPALYSAENSSPTRPSSEDHPYLRAVDDPVSFGRVRIGHGHGFSQFGGKRWADLGWSHRQILGHYYMGASLEPPTGDDATLLDVLNRPTSPYLRGRGVFLDVNAWQVAGTQARLWRPADDGALRAGDWHRDDAGGDGWQHLLVFEDVADALAGRMRVEVAATDAVSESRSLSFGIDRTPPVLTTTLALGFTSGADLAFDAFDATSGVERIGWSYAHWTVEGEDTDGSRVVEDPTASGGAALRLDPARDAAGEVTLPSISVGQQHYRMWMRIRAVAPITDTEHLAVVRAYDQESQVRGIRYLRAADVQDEAWTWIFLDVDPTEDYHDPAARRIVAAVAWPGKHVLDIDRVFLATRPDSVLRYASVPLMSPEPLLVYAADVAGNVALVACEVDEVSTEAPHRLYVPWVVGGARAVGTQPQHRYVCTAVSDR